MTDSIPARDSAARADTMRLQRNEPQCIVVPLDGSSIAERALPIAITLASATGAEVRAVHVVVPLPRGADVHGLFDYAANVEAQLEHDAGAYVRDVRRRFPSAGKATPPLHVDLSRARPMRGPFGEAARTVSALERYAKRHSASLFVMTSHGRGGFSRAWIGNVADSIIRGTGVPVLIVRPEDSRAASGTFRKLMVAVDGSALAERVIPFAMAVAAVKGARITLVRVITVHWAVARSSPVAHVDSHDLAVQRKEAERYLLDLKGRIVADGLTVETMVVDEPVTPVPDVGPARALLQFAESLGADLIALSTHGRSGFKRWMLGSVADKIVRGATIATLLVRSDTPEANARGAV